MATKINQGTSIRIGLQFKPLFLKSKQTPTKVYNEKTINCKSSHQEKEVRGVINKKNAENNMSDKLKSLLFSKSIFRKLVKGRLNYFFVINGFKN